MGSVAQVVLLGKKSRKEVVAVEGVNDQWRNKNVAKEECRAGWEGLSQGGQIAFEVNANEEDDGEIWKK